MLSKTCTNSTATGRGRGFGSVFTSVTAVGVILLGLGFYGAWQVHNLQRRGENILSDNVASIRAAEELEIVIREFQYRLKRALATLEPRHLKMIGERLADAEQALGEAEKLATTSREQQLIRRIRHGFSRFLEDFEHIRAGPLSEASAPITLSLADEVIPNKILIYLGKYVQLNEEQLARSSERNQTNARQLMFGLLLLGTCGGVAGLSAGYLIARRINHTIVQLSLPIRDTAGKLDEVVGPVAISSQPGFEDLQAVLQTVSEHVSTVVERLQDRERETLRAEQLAAVGQLAAGMAHELRNPLTVVKAVLQLASSSSDLTQQDLHVLREEIHRLEQSVQSFLDFARPPQPEKRAVDLVELLRQISAFADRRALRQQIRLMYDPPEHPVLIVADATQLRQVILNLILNSFDAVQHQGTVRIELEKTETAPTGAGAFHGDGIVIRIRDTGPGLPADLGERIFHPFVSTKETGLGLGLSICRRIVEAHGGTIKAASGPDEGAVFTIWLPAREPLAKQHPPDASPRAERLVGVSG